jgi:Fur family iron response transcriptional regulator
MSLATVYNTLKTFVERGLIRRLPIGGGRSVFDTDPRAHHHFVVRGEDIVFDIADRAVALDALPPPPPGFRIAGYELNLLLERVAPEAAR